MKEYSVTYDNADSLIGEGDIALTEDRQYEFIYTKNETKYTPGGIEYTGMGRLFKEQDGWHLSELVWDAPSPVGPAIGILVIKYELGTV